MSYQPSADSPYLLVLLLQYKPETKRHQAAERGIGFLALHLPSLSTERSVLFSLGSNNVFHAYQPNALIHGSLWHAKDARLECFHRIGPSNVKHTNVAAFYWLPNAWEVQSEKGFCKKPGLAG